MKSRRCKPLNKILVLQQSFKTLYLIKFKILQNYWKQINHALENMHDFRIKPDGNFYNAQKLKTTYTPWNSKV